MLESLFNKFSSLKTCNFIKRDPSIGIFIGMHLSEAIIQRCSIKKGVVKNLAKLTRKQLCWSLFFNKVAGLFWPNTSCGCFCSVLLPWRLHQKRIWIAKDLRERNFLWRNKWNCESHNFRINNTVKTEIDIFSYCLRLDMKEMRIFFFIYKNYSEWMNFLYVYIIYLI